MTNDSAAAADAVPPTTEPSPPSSSSPPTTTTTSSSPSLSSKLRKKLPLLLILPYLIGLLWSTLHPIVSIVTGETKCRGSFIDENGLDPNQYRIPSYPTTTFIERRASISTGGDDGGLCDSLWSSGSGSRCLKLDNMEVAKIIPPSSPVVPVEAVVLIVNAPPHGRNWRTNDFHMALLTLMERLGDVEACPWLAKTVFVVTPKKIDEASMVGGGLEEIVMEFLDGYLGVGNTNTDGYNRNNASLFFPPSFTSELIRTILVLDVDETTSTTNKYYSELQILSQGKRGVLPNMDLVFATVSTFRNSIFNNGGKKGKLRMHPFGELEYWLEDKVEETVKSKEMKNYMLDMGGLLMFGVSMVLGPHPPHAPILDRGIDSLTITARYPPAGIKSSSSSSVRSSTNNNLYATEFVRSIEQLLRSLSNLHERLHHSITQYLLPSPTKFVSNNEYIFPVILLMIPLVIRAIFLVFVDIHRFCFKIALSTMGVCIGVSICFLTINAFVMEATVPIVNALYGIGYVVALSALHRQTTKEKELNLKGAMKQSVQFVSCILAIYMHVPIALCHVTLAFPSALLWTPLLAFPSYHDKRRQHDVARIIRGVILLIMWPPFFLVPIVMGQYTTYVLMVYTPLHLLLTSLWLL